ncbi:MAG: hypothetical protein NC337_14230 [Roseburia sp.]|nr:hypothetical protein [Roseburia sp.]
MTREQQEEYIAYRKEVYSEYPEVERFERRKKRVGTVLLGCTVVVYLFRMAVKGVVFEDTWSFASLYMGFFLQLMFISSAMRTRWKSAWLLYLLVFNQIIEYIQAFRQAQVGSWAELFALHRYGFSQYPLETGVDILNYIYTFLVLLFALWLTLIPSNRRYAEQADELEQEIKAYFGGWR